MANHSIDDLEKSGGILAAILGAIFSLFLGAIFKLNTKDSGNQANIDVDSKK